MSGRRHRMQLAAAALGLATAATAGGDASDAYRSALKEVALRERRFWDGFRERQAAAQQVARAPWREMVKSMGGRGSHVDVEFDHSAFRDLYDDYAAIERDRVTAAKEIARQHGALAIEPLWKDLVATCRAVDAAEGWIVSLDDAAGETWAAADQEPGIRRHGLQFRLEGLVEALARVPEMPGFVAGTGWQEASKGDAERSITRRVALLDLLASAKAPEGVPIAEQALAAKWSSLRVAAAECLLRIDPAPKPALVAVLRDRAPPVRRALLVAVRTHAKDRPAWIPLLVDRLPETRGLERAECLATLAALAGRDLGPDPAAWKAWCDSVRPALESGTFRPGEDAGTTPTVASPAAGLFYSVALPGEGIVFVLDGTDAMLVPADYDVQCTRAYLDWASGDRGWRKTHPRHKEVQDGEFAQAVAGLDPGTRFAVIVRTDQRDLKVLGDRKPLRGATDDGAKAARFVEGNPPGGYRCELVNLRFALDLAGLPAAGLDFPDAWADTVLFVGDGSLRGGSYLDPEAAALAFARWNRFRRVVLHTIRVCNAGKESEEFLRRLADVGGGTYRWQRKPP